MKYDLVALGYIGMYGAWITYLVRSGIVANVNLALMALLPYPLIADLPMLAISSRNACAPIPMRLG